MSIKEQDIKHILSLLDDPEDAVFKSILPTIVANFVELTPHFAVLLASEHDTIRTDRLIGLTQFMHYKLIEERFLVYSRHFKPEPSLLEGVILFERLSYTDFDEDAFRKFVKMLSQKVWLRLTNDITGYEIASILQDVFKQEKISTSKGVVSLHLSDYCSMDEKQMLSSQMKLLCLIVCQENNIPLRPIKMESPNGITSLGIGYISKQTAQAVHNMSQHGILYAINDKMKLYFNSVVEKAEPVPYFYYLKHWQFCKYYAIANGGKQYSVYSTDNVEQAMKVLNKHIKL